MLTTCLDPALSSTPLLYLLVCVQVQHSQCEAEGAAVTTSRHNKVSSDRQVKRVGAAVEVLSDQGTCQDMLMHRTHGMMQQSTTHHKIASKFLFILWFHRALTHNIFCCTFNVSPCTQLYSTNPNNHQTHQ